MSTYYDYSEQAETVLQAAIDAGLDMFPKITKHRDKASLQFGYSNLYFTRAGVSGRREGEGEIGQNPISISYEDDDWVEQCVDILSSGRTVECGKGVGMKDICERIHWQTVDYQLQHMHERLLDPEHFNLDPDYQRSHVWSVEQREQFMGFLLENGRMPLIFLQDNGDLGAYEVIDGKQRLTSCSMFIQGEIAARLSDGRRIWWKDFNERDRRVIPNIKCAIVKLPNKAAILRFYLKLNRGGTVHSDEEIERVRKLLEAEEAKS